MNSRCKDFASVDIKVWERRARAPWVGGLEWEGVIIVMIYVLEIIT